MTVPAKSGAPEILRSFQKDESFLEYLKSKIANLVQNSLGTYYWLQYHKVIEILCELLYYGVTTLSLRQTLGEEYTGILQYNRASNQLPSFVVRLLSVVIQCGGPYAVQKLVNRFEKSLTSGSLSTYLKPEIKFILLNQIPLLKLFPALFLKLHLAAFYINGSFYHLSKRITGINYILVRNWLGNNSVGNTFKIIGVVLFLNAVLSSCYSIYEILKKKNLKNKIRYTSEQLTDPSKRCSLCLGTRKAPSVTPCGHMFCWNCIHEWLQSSNFCPLCRHEASSPEIIPLLNYS